MSRWVCVLVTWASVFVCGWMILGTVYDDVSVSYGSTFVCLFCMQMWLKVSLITSCIIVLRVLLQWVEAGCGVCSWPCGDLCDLQTWMRAHQGSSHTHTLMLLQEWPQGSSSLNPRMGSNGSFSFSLEIVRIVSCEVVCLSTVNSVFLFNKFNNYSNVNKFKLLYFF